MSHNKNQKTCVNVESQVLLRFRNVHMLFAVAVVVAYARRDCVNVTDCA